MQRAVLFFFTGLTCGLFVTTGGISFSTPQSSAPSRLDVPGFEVLAGHAADEPMGGADSPAPMGLQAGVLTAQDPAPAAANSEETDRERLERKVRKLLKDNGTEAMQKRSMEGMLGQFEKAGLPPEFGKKFMARFDFDHLMDMCVRVYADHLDEATVDALAAFYATPSGKKLAEATPDITVELTEAGMEYGQKIGAEVYEEMSK